MSALRDYPIPLLNHRLLDLIGSGRVSMIRASSSADDQICSYTTIYKQRNLRVPELAPHTIIDPAEAIFFASILTFRGQPKCRPRRDPSSSPAAMAA